MRVRRLFPMSLFCHFASFWLSQMFPVTPTSSVASVSHWTFPFHFPMKLHVCTMSRLRAQRNTSFVTYFVRSSFWCWCCFSVSRSIGMNASPIAFFLFLLLFTSQIIVVSDRRRFFDDFLIDSFSNETFFWLAAAVVVVVLLDPEEEKAITSELFLES